MGTLAPRLAAIPASPNPTGGYDKPRRRSRELPAGYRRHQRAILRHNRKVRRYLRHSGARPLYVRRIPTEVGIPFLLPVFATGQPYSTIPSRS
jgi:hypothetical protein